MRAADLIVECLVEQGADRLFCVPGESYLALLDSLHSEERIDTVVCRHEGGAGFMAVADAKLTGKPGLLAVSRGPGATNAAIALHLAEQDAVPLVVLIGQVARWERGRGAFQEVDYTQVFGSIAKGVWEVADAAYLPETLARAWHVAQSGTPGPVVIALPEDMLLDGTEAAVVPALPCPVTGPGGAEMQAVAALLAQAERPLVIAGGGLDNEAGRAALARLAGAHDLPVALTFKHQEIFDNSSPCFAGYLGFKIPKPQVDALKEADLILAIGTRLGDTPTQGYTLPNAPEPAQKLVHVWPDAGAIGRVFRTDIGMPCDPARFCEALADRGGAPGWAAWTRRLNGIARGYLTYEMRTFEDGLDFGVVVAEIVKHAPQDTILSTDSGNFSSWVHRLWRWNGSQKAVGAAGGAMGMGVPGAVAACLRHPGQCVMGFVGDGGVMMTGNELATGIAQDAKPKIVVSNNGSYGTIRLHQERDYPRRTSGTDLANPDFAAWGRAFGALGLTVRTAAEVPEAVAAMMAHDGAVVMDVHTSLEAISAYTSVTALRG